MTWQSQFLETGDVNGDGRRDVITVDNQKSLLEIHVQKAEGDRRFERRERILEHVAYSLSVADLNGDGRDDVLIGSQPTVILYQDEQGQLSQLEEVRVPGYYAAAGDLNGDGRSDVVVFDKDRFSLLLQTADGRLGQAREFPNAISTDQPPDLIDLDGDGRTDLMYADSQRKNEIAVRYQQAAGEFGPEQKLKVGFYKQLAPVRRPEAGTAAALVSVEQRTNAIKLMERSESTSRVEAYSAGPVQLLALPTNARAAGLTVLAADLDGDGLDNIALFSRDVAEVAFYGWNRRGAFEHRTRPVLTDVVAVAAPPAATSPPLFVLSRKEQAIGIMRPQARGFYSVPQPIDLKTAPLAIACGDLDGDGREDLVYCTKNTTGGLEIRRWAEGDTATTEPRSLVVSLPKSTGGDVPLALQMVDLDGNGRHDLVLFFEYRLLEIFVQDKAGRFRRLLTGEGVLKGLFSELSPERFWVDDVDGDGRPEVLVARESFARALRIEPDGPTTVVDQFNGKNPSAQINAVVTGDLDGDGDKEVLLLDRPNNCVTVYAREKDGAYRLATNIDLPNLQLYRLLVGHFNEDKADDLVIVSERALAVLFGGGRQAKLTTRWRQQTKTEDGYYALVEAGDVDGDKRDEILALENHEHVLEFYRVGPTGDPERVRQFKVFDDLRSPQYRGGKREAPPQPREIWVGDLDGDARSDLVLLAHDRLLIYFQKPAE